MVARTIGFGMAAGLIAAAAAWVWLGSRADLVPAPVDPNTPAPLGVRMELPLSDPIKEAETEYLQAKRELRGVIEKQADAIDPEVLEPVERNLGFIENAVIEVMMALAQNPESDSLRQTLVDMYAEEIELLRKALRLTNPN